MNFSPKKIIIFLIVFLLIFNSSGSLLKPTILKLSPPKAEAVWWSTFPQQIIDQAWKVATWLKDNWGKIMRDIVAKRIMDYIVDETVQWIQGGGEPKFVTDWNGFLNDAFQAGVGDVIQQTNLAWLCKPFGLQLRISLLPIPKFSQRVTCTLDDIVSNIQNFYDDFQNGSWIAYEQSWWPENNYYGTLYMTMDEMMIRGAQQQQAAQNEALAGKGFLSVKKCVRTGRTDQNDPSTEKCLEYRTVTPGDTVGQVVADSMTSDIQWAANIQSWTSALVNAVINRVTTEGIGLMKPSSETSYGSYYPTEYQGTANEEIGQQKQEMIDEISKINNEWRYILSAKKKSLSYIEQTNGILQELQNLQNQLKGGSSGLPAGCTPEVKSEEISALDSEISRLMNEVSNLETKVNEANKIINDIKSSITVRETTIAQQKFTDFMNKYNTTETQTEITDGSAQKAADSETQTKRTELEDSRRRLEICRAS